MNPSHCVELNDGHRIPMLGFGTYAPEEVPKSMATEATKIAIDAGFRHIDAAYLYQNEEEVGLAIRNKIADGTVKREDIFYTSKLPSTCHRPELVQLCLEKSLKKLQLDYVDLYLIHFPVSMKPGDDFNPVVENGKLLLDTVDLCDTWEAMEKCKDAGLAKSIGVSNFNRKQLEMILNKPGLKYKPVCNQVECHPYFNQKKLLDYCKSKDIVLVAYGALGTQRYKNWVDDNAPFLLEDPVLCAMAEKHKRTPALISLRYLLQRGIVTVAKSFNEKRIKENMQIQMYLLKCLPQCTHGLIFFMVHVSEPKRFLSLQLHFDTVSVVFEFQLPPEDMATLDGLNKNYRYVTADLNVKSQWKASEMIQRAKALATELDDLSFILGPMR